MNEEEFQQLLNFLKGQIIQFLTDPQRRLQIIGIFQEKDNCHFNDYIWIKEHFSQFQNNTNPNEHEFRHCFERFYILNPYLNQAQKNRYFELLAERQTDIQDILDKLHLIPSKKYWLAYATKLIHTIDNNKPIYDGNVRAALTITENQELPNDLRLKWNESLNIDGTPNRCVDIYDKLGVIYQNFLSDQRIIDILTIYRNQIKVFVPRIDEVSDVKLLDSLLWAMGGLI